MVGAAVDLARFNPLIGDVAYKTLPDKTIAAIIDSNGVVIARSSESEKWVGTNRSSYPVVSKMLELKSGVVTITSAIDSFERFYAITPIEGTTWYATVGIPTGPINEAIQREFTNSLLTIILGFSVILLFGMWLGRLIVRPLSAVAATADAVAHGNFDRRTPDAARRGVVEVAIVARQLDAMLDALDQERKNVAEGESRLQIMALYDPLTHLPNRRLLNEHLAQTLAAFKIRNNHGAILVIDLDNFKSINDTRGHSVGDQLIVATSERLLNSVRPRDWVARLGGDEFVVVVEDLSPDHDHAANAAEEVAERILLSIRQQFELEAKPYHATASIGIYLFRDGSEGIDELLKRADAAMYLAKKAGRNTLRFFDPVLQAGLEEKMSLESDLHNALPNNQLSLHYQPQFDSSSHIVGAEVLLRWSHPERGHIPPNHFIVLAEETGLIISIGTWVLETACRQLTVWANQPAYENMYLAVNVSARQFAQPNFVDIVKHALSSTGANPNRLKIEITESLVLNDVDGTIKKMIELQCLGLTFSIDDFGTGYSSLSYLRQLPITQLKIDRSFVMDIASEPSAAAIARTIIGMAHTLDLTVVAEGVETLAQFAFLKRHGCDCFQGYLMGRPVPLPDFVVMVANHYKHNTDVVG